MNFGDLTQVELARLNSATKYPSIPTYHVIEGDRGRLTEQLSVDFQGAPVQITEKIDGTNARIILPPLGHGNPIIGSREELLYYLGDLIYNRCQGIVETVLPYLRADLINDPATLHTHIVTIYGEAYGYKELPASKQYTSTRTTAFRVFDIAMVPQEVLSWPVDQVAAWRDHGGPVFLDTCRMAELAAQLRLPMVPSVHRSLALTPPTGIAETLAWLQAVAPSSKAVLDGGAGGRAEGVVIRTTDRTKIAKLRFRDYRRTLEPQPARRGKPATAVTSE